MDIPSPVSSRQHPIVRRCRAVAAGRGEPGVVLLDGEHVCRAAIDAAVPIEALLADTRAAALARDARATGITVHDVATAVLDAASPARTPSGAVALARWAPGSVADVMPGRAGLTLALVDVQDPGNVGSIIRSADALDAAAVLTLGATADPGSWKALRGAMGSTFRVAIARGDTQAALDWLHDQGWRTVVTTARGGDAIDDWRFDLPTVLLLGNEGSGLPPAVAAQARGRLTIPMRRGVESLNVATTAAIIAYEARRHRGAHG